MVFEERSVDMIRLRRYIKPYLLLLLAAFFFLFVQGMADLYLPNLMSDMVNVGIQRSGVEHNAPEVLSSDAFSMLCRFSDDEDLLKKAYEPLSSEQERYKALAEAYPSVSDPGYQPVRLSGKVLQEEADKAVEKAEAALVFSLQKLSGRSETVSNTSLTREALPELYAAVSMVPSLIREEAIAEAAETDESILSGTGAAFSLLFLKEAGADPDAVRIRYIAGVGGKMLLVTILGAIASLCVSFLAAKTGAGVARRLREDVFQKVEQFSHAEFDRFSTASLINRTTNDVTQIQNILNMIIRMVCYAPIMGIGGAVLALQTNVSMSRIIIAAILLLLTIMIVVFIIAMPKFKILQSLIDRLNLVTREILTGTPVIRAFGTEAHEEKRFDQANQDLTGVTLFVNRVMTVLMPLMTLIMSSISVVIVWSGSHLIDAGEIQIGDMMAFIQYSMMVIIAFLFIAVMFIMIPRASVSAMRISEVLDCELSITDPPQPEHFPEDVKGRVCFDHVCFRYQGASEDVLHDISFTAEAGETTAIIGMTGSGKSTLIHLIPRFYDVTAGQITIDGVDIRRVTQHELREQIGLVPQKGVLFSGDIASNLRYGRRDATEEEIAEASRISQAEEFISEKPEGFHSPIAQGGTNVSGGQKQRLAIARALVKCSPVYLFDDSFSALDFKTDAALRTALKKHTGHSTVLIVAQRISTIMYADKIIVLDRGRIAGMGTHNQLLKDCEIYREIAVSQNSDREV